MSPRPPRGRAAGARSGPAAGTGAAGPAGRGPGPRRLVCKMGGSLLDAGRAPAVVRILARVAPRFRLLVLAGGGRAADRLRVRHARGEISREEAHWAAVRVLDVNALRLAGGCGRNLPLVASLPVSGAGISVLAPRALLRTEDPTPHSWAATSDSISAWCALRLDAADLVLLKSRDGAPRPVHGGPPRRPARRASDEGLVDDHFPSLLDERGPRAWVLDGRRPARLVRWLTGDRAAATRLIPDA